MTVRLHQSAWPSDDLGARLTSSDVVVVTASLLCAGAEIGRTLEFLRSAERIRFAEYTNPVVARRFACGRSLLRSILASVLLVEPGDVPLREGIHGKLYLAGGAEQRLWFSVAHSDDLLVVAMSCWADVGVDVERSRAFEQWQRVAERVLDPQEWRQLLLAIERGGDPGHAFLRHWCRVEAELKAIGCGIAGLEAHRAGDRPRGLRLADLADLPMPSDLAVLGARYQGAVALCTPGAESVRQTIVAAPHDAMPVRSPATASTP